MDSFIKTESAARWHAQFVLSETRPRPRPTERQLLALWLLPRPAVALVFSAVSTERQTPPALATRMLEVLVSRIARQPQQPAPQGSARRPERRRNEMGRMGPSRHFGLSNNYCYLVLVASTLVILLRRPGAGVDGGNGRGPSALPASQAPSPTQPTYGVRKRRGLLNLRRTVTSFERPRVLGVFAYPTESNYVLMTERLDPHLIDYASEFQRRHRREHNRRKSKVKFKNIAEQYQRAIHGSDMDGSDNSTAYLLPDDPLASTMLTERERANWFNIREGSEDYVDLKADELNDDSCEVLSAEHSKWMEHHFPSW